MTPRRGLAIAVAITTAVAVLPSSSGAVRRADHSDWPVIDGALILNRTDQSRPIDMRVGHDPFAFTDPSYSCDGVHANNACFIKAGACLADGTRCAAPPRVPAGSRRHNELLGGHGNDTIHAGPAGDVVWGDYNYPTNPPTQRDRLFGGPGPDFLYASHGTNIIHTGGGRDAVLARVGRGEIHCDSASTVVNLSRRTRKRYRLFGCRHITLKAIGTKQFPG